MIIRRAAFSLIELLIVIAIILLLMGLMFPIIGHIQRKKKLVLATTEVGDLKAAAELYQQHFGSYPPDTGNFATGDLADAGFDPDSIYKYLSIRRVDPKTGEKGGPYFTFDPYRLKGPNGSTYVDPWGNPYQLDAFHMDKTGVKIGEPYPNGGTPADAARKVADIKVWSNGPDGKDSTGSNQWEGKGTTPEDQDNIDSWAQ